MPSGKLYSLAKMNTATTGTGTITLSTVASGFITFANAGVSNGETVTYCIEDGANREVGYGVYSTSGTTLTRNVLKSTNSDAAINLSGTATVGITAAAENFYEWFRDIDANGFNLGMDDNTGINDDSGNEVVRFRKTASAVNYVEILNTETTVGPAISSAGDDTNINLNLVAKGSGAVTAKGVEVVTTSGTQTLTNKTLTSPTLTAPLTVANGGTGQATEAEAVGELIQALTADSSPDNAADYIATYDASADTGKKVLLSVVVREKLSAARTYYVRTDGSDSNTGLVDSSGGAFLTVQKAINTIYQLDLNGYDATVSIGSGTFATASFASQIVGGNVILSGAGAASTTLTSSTGSGVIDVTSPQACNITLTNFKITSTGSAVSGIRIIVSARVVLSSGMEFGACSGSHILCAAPGAAFVATSQSYTISGGAIAHLNAQITGVIRVDSTTVTVSGTPAFSSTFANCTNEGLIFASSASYSGAATGVRYTATTGGGISTNGGGASFFPGNSAGSATSPGWYA